MATSMVASADRISVVHVDDEPSFGEVSATFLERMADGFEVTDVTSGTEALDLVREGVDCVVSDYDMPGMDGLELLAKVREVDEDLPFILFTGKGSEEIASQAISEGVSDYIQKGRGTDQYTLLVNRIQNLVGRYRTERTLRRRLHAIETASEGIAILDAEGVYTYMNRAYAAAYGYEPEDIVGNHWHMLYGPDEAARFEDDILPKMEEQGSWHGEAVGMRADGSPFPESVSVAMLDDGGHVCVVRDLTEQVELDASLRQERDLMDRLFETSPVGIVLVDSDRVIVRANDRAATLLRMDLDDIIGTTYDDPDWGLYTFDGEEYPIERHPTYRVLEAGEKVVGEDMVVTRGDGERFECKVNAAPLFDPGGELEYVVVMFDDITEVEVARRQLETALDQLADANDLLTDEVYPGLGVARSHLRRVVAGGPVKDHVLAAQGAIERLVPIVDDLTDLTTPPETESDDERAVLPGREQD
ncbi:PAS domain-containing protein [Haloarchaeobius sp. HME9146]|uniref:PAS domain-containing response regulator n=1 Tax=Haloarchaeobius sp. HME9146 TaxID=2978732 RepID=UPI0021BE7484|nr:PAS domain-containing protein [Haloarchaeobius sp. HME9146]MCT9094532.1 PAS domain S-box protein [Haloarchaeobius sp. HME9146]